jgi:putative photosynthetic complex assembly protein
MSETLRSHDPTLPRGVLTAVGALVLITVGAVAAVRLSGIDIREPDAAAAQSRALRFADTRDGQIAVIDAASGQTLTQIAGEGGFIRGALRALARERKIRGLDGSQPFVLIGRADGRLTLEDPATGQRIDLESFGPMHAGTFARLLALPVQPSASSHGPATTNR